MLGLFYRSFSAQKLVNKSTNLLKACWRLAGALSGAFLAVLGLSWKAQCSKSIANKNETRVVKKTCFRHLAYPRLVLGAVLANFC